MQSVVVRQLDLDPRNRALPSWNSVEYARRLAAQRRGELIQLVAWSEGVPVGRAHVLFAGHEVWSESAEREGCPEVRDVDVADQHRRRRIALVLMAALETAVRDGGGDRIGLGVSLEADGAPARSLYRALGYRAAHGPMITSVTLDTDRGPVPVGG